MLSITGVKIKEKKFALVAFSDNNLYHVRDPSIHFPATAWWSERRLAQIEGLGSTRHWFNHDRDVQARYKWHQVKQTTYCVD